MAYYGNAPADVALVVGQDVITTTEIQDATIATADIASDAITATKIDDDGTGFQMGSLGLGTAVSGSEKLTVGGTASFTDDVSLSVAGKRYYIPRASDGALTGSLYSSTGNTITLSGAGSSSGQINFIPSASNSSAVALTLDSSQNATFAGNLTVNGTGSDVITGDYLYLDAHNNSGAKNLVFRQLDDTWLGQIEFHPSSTAQIVTRVAQPLALGANNTQILKLRHETNQWGAEITSQSPYGLHVHTTGTSSGHDALKVSRHDDAILFHVFADANTINKNALTVQGTATSSFAGQVNFAGNVTVDGDRYMLTESGTNKGFFGKDDWATSGGSANDVNVGSYSGEVKLTAGAQTNATPNITCNTNKSVNFSGGISTPKGVGYVVHSVNVASGSSSSYNLNGMGGNCSVGFYAGACKRDASITADNSTHIGVHQHTQGSNTYSDLLSRNDDSGVTLARSGSNLTCTNNGNSTVNFIVKYFNLIALDGSNNLA